MSSSCLAGQLAAKLVMDCSPPLVECVGQKRRTAEMTLPMHQTAGQRGRGRACGCRVDYLDVISRPQPPEDEAAWSGDCDSSIRRKLVRGFSFVEETLDLRPVENSEYSVDSILRHDAPARWNSLTSSSRIQ